MIQINFAVCDDDEIVLDAVCQRVHAIFKRCGVEATGVKYLSPVKLYEQIKDGEKIDIRMTMDELERELSKYDIVRTHKGFLVNLKYVQRIDTKGITLPGGVVAGLSRTKVQEVRAQYLKYLRKTGASLISN